MAQKLLNTKETHIVKLAIGVRISVVFAGLFAGTTEATSRMLMDVHIVAILVVSDVFVLYTDAEREQRREEEDCEEKWSIRDE